MDNASCNLIYVDRSVREDRTVGASSLGSKDAPQSSSDSFHAAAACETRTLRENVRLLLEFIGDVRLCSTGAACMSQLFDLHDISMVELKPTVVLIDVPNSEHVPPEKSSRSGSRSPSPHSNSSADGSESAEFSVGDDVYGLRLLQKIISEAHIRNLSSLVVPIPLISFPDLADPVSADTDATPDGIQAPGDLAESFGTSGGSIGINPRKGPLLADRRLLRRCLDLGATDVMINPLNCVTSIQIHAYRAHKEAAKERQAILEVRRGRKRSWVGVDEQKPFAYLREAMVSGLMNGICRPGETAQVDRGAAVRVTVPPERRSQIARLICKWHFCAHDLSDDELIVAASSIFRHALALPELEHWRISTDQLTTFLVACRAAYNSFVPYHNFRHVVDVLQATFNFLIQIGSLPPLPFSGYDAAAGVARKEDKSPMARLIHPFEALTLLITAIGHDVGHPGVNNGFLVVLNAPLAQLYNDRSVLESFHCAAYSQILRRHWPAAFEHSPMRNLMISSILATDMGLHFDYMKKLGDLQDKLHENNSTEGWNGRMLEEQKALVCALLIKCADISNVARRHDTAVQWMHVLSDEFSRQASMETELEIPSSLMAPPKKDVVALSKAQLGFMNLFAIPLFQGVADILPQMQYCVDELAINKALFDQRVADETAKQEQAARIPLQLDGTMSPRTMSIAITAEGRSGGSASGAARGGPTVRAGADPVNETKTAGAARVAALIPTTSEEKETGPPCKPPSIPRLSGEYKEINGIVTTFDAVADFVSSDPFNVNDGQECAPRHQRGSEATEGSASATGGGDWASQATSATTGKMPLSPSTQGTSIVSQESLERAPTVPITTVTAPDVAAAAHTTESAESAKSATTLNYPQTSVEVSPSISLEEESVASINGKVSGDGTKTLKKKTSRFRMNAFPFFRRHKSTSPPLPAADTAG